MTVFRFTLQLADVDYDDDTANILFEAGCNDATVSYVKGVVTLDFARTALSAGEAVKSALADVLSTGAIVKTVATETVLI